MRAAVYKGERVLEVEDIPTPTAGPGEVVIRVRYCAVCGTDVHAFMYDVAPPGTVMGHEYCGIVTEVGEGRHALAGWRSRSRRRRKPTARLCADGSAFRPAL